MIDAFEKTTIQDMALAKALGMSENEVKALSLHQMRILMQRKAFKMRDANQTITQEEANELNQRLQEIMSELIEADHDYDPSADYIVDFDNYVVGNPEYNRFCW